MINTTLCYLEKDGCYLMLHRVKKQNDLNRDKWLGVGGHFEPGESPEECVVREVKEETGLTLTEYRLRGIVTFELAPLPTEYMFLYTATGFTGEMTECAEGTLEWVKKEDVLSLPIWEGDRLFFEELRRDRGMFSLKLTYEGNRLADSSVSVYGAEGQGDGTDTPGKAE